MMLLLQGRSCTQILSLKMLTGGGGEPLLFPFLCLDGYQRPMNSGWGWKNSLVKW